MKADMSLPTPQDSLVETVEQVIGCYDQAADLLQAGDFTGGTEQLLGAGDLVAYLKGMIEAGKERVPEAQVEREYVSRLLARLNEARARVEEVLETERKSVATEMRESTRGLLQLGRLRQLVGYHEARRLDVRT